MSDTALKFGPEWLRALSHGNSVSSPPPSPGLPKYKLAEYRYGREEMLALFDKNVPPPEELVGFGMLFQEKLQMPLALTLMTQDEGRLWNQSFNSDAVLRLMGRGTAPPAARGRGGSVDRGRGRGRGGYYTRGLSFDEDLEPRREGPPGDFPRGPPRTFERTQSERGWPERNGGEEWNGTSPRKDYSRAPVDNWRSRGEDEEGWRTSGRCEKWGRGSWRSERVGGGDGGFDHEHERGVHDHDDHIGQRRWDDDPRRNKAWVDNPHGWRSSEDNDALPEWVTENPGESGGSFDASGAFHGGAWSEEEEEGKRDGCPPSQRSRRKSKSPSRLEKSDHFRHQTEVPPKEKPSSAEVSESVHTSPSKTQDSVKEPRGEGQTTECTSTSRETDQNYSEKTDSSNVTVRDDREEENWEEEWEAETESGPNVNKVVEIEKPVNNDSTESHVQFDTQLLQKCEPITKTPEPEQPMPDSVKVTRPVITSDSRQKSEDENMEHMKAVADTVVAKLIEDEQEHEEHETKPPVTNSSTEKWYYRDPQGEIQGPFLAGEMSDWYTAGYFTMNLLVRRECDDRFSQLGDIIKLWGRVPFNPGPTPPPLKTAEPSPPPDQEKLLLLQQQLVQQQLIQQQILQQQLFLRQQSAVLSKMSQMEGWSSLTPQQQQQMLAQNLLSQQVGGTTGPLLQQIGMQMEQKRKRQAGMLPPKDSIQALLAQLQQPKTTSASETLLSSQQLKGDPLQSLLQQLQTLNPEVPKVDNDPLQSLMQQLTKRMNGPVPAPPQAETVWGGVPNTLPSTAPWPPQSTHQVPPPPHLHEPIPTPATMPASVWDTKEEELQQQQQMEMRRREEDRRKREEEMRQQEEKQRRNLEEQRLEEERLQEERRLQEEYRKQEEKRLEEERKRLEELRRQEEERKRLEEERERKKQEEQKRQEELRRKAEEEAERKRQEELRCEEERRKRQEEERRKREEELQRRAEEERIRQEEERRRLQELQKEEEERKRQEEEQLAQTEEEQQRLRRKQDEALWKLREQQKAKATLSPWSTHNNSPSQETHSLAEIQKHQEEKERKERQFQQQLREQEQREMQAQQKNASQMILKWANQSKSPTRPAVKSLAEIQAEQAKSLAKEKEQNEKHHQQSHLSLASAGVWGSAAQNLTWAMTSHSNSQHQTNWANMSSKNSVWGDPPMQNMWGVNMMPLQNTHAGGFWEEAYEVTKKSKTVKKEKGPVKPNSVVTNCNKALRSRNKKDEETVMKLFEQNMSQPADDFTQWCCKSLSGLQESVDVPTFVSFLKDVESPYEVYDYVRSYLGESKDMQEFAKQFLERRSKWRNAQKANPAEDNMYIPARAINPQQNEFHEVKNKGKKGRKGKMQKMDMSVLGFNVTAAPDRINVGERDLGEM